MSKIQKANSYIKRVLTKEGIPFEEQISPQNPRIVAYMFSLGKNIEEFWNFVVSYDDKSDALILMTKSISDIKGIPEYDILQWINESNTAIPNGCFVYEKEEQMLYLHQKLDAFVLENTAEWNASENELYAGESILIKSILSMFHTIQREEESIAVI